jgi:hypothetical protein
VIYRSHAGTQNYVSDSYREKVIIEEWHIWLHAQRFNIQDASIKIARPKTKTEIPIN